MWAIPGIILTAITVSLCISAGYFRTARAAKIRLAVSLILFFGGLITAALTVAIFSRGGGVSSEWASNAFFMFVRFSTVIAVFAAAVLTLSVFFGRKARDTVLRRATTVLFCIAVFMFTGLFASMTEDGETLVHMYVSTFGAGVSLLPVLSFAVEEILFLKGEKDSCARAAQNNNRK